MGTEEKKSQEQDNAKEAKEEKKIEPKAAEPVKPTEESAKPAAEPAKPTEENAKSAAEPAKQKGPARQAKSLTNLRPGECGGCGKAIRKATWYYRNGAFYCTKRCYTRKQKGETVKK